MQRFIFALLLALIVAGRAVGQTPDTQPPAEETVCADLSGAAFGLCNAYCEAQDCDAQDPERASCEQLRRNFERLTGTPTFPCDRFCGDGTVDPDLGEVCDPPGSRCIVCLPCPPCEAGKEEERACPPCLCIKGTCTDDCSCGPVVRPCDCGNECFDPAGNIGVCREVVPGAPCECIAFE